MRYISVFSGIEAATVAWEPLGWEPVAFCEIDPFPSAVLAHRYPNVPNLGDITEVDWKEVIAEYGTADVVVGGSPCQSFSIAGGREGLDGESRLMYEYIRCVKEVGPRWLVWENVPGVLSDRRNAYGCLIEALSRLGYSLAWRILDAQFFGVAQRRRRVFLVGHIGDGCPPAAVLFERESVSGNTASSKLKREELARAAGRGPGGGGGIGAGGLMCLESLQANTTIQIESAPTLNCLHEQPIVIDRAAFNQGEGALYSPHIERTELMDSLVARGPHAVAQPTS